MSLNKCTGISTSQAVGGSGTPTASTPLYQTIIGYTRTTITVPLIKMVCSDDTQVSLNGAILTSGFSRSGNTYTFNFDLVEGDALQFKN